MDLDGSQEGTNIGGWYCSGGGDTRKKCQTYDSAPALFQAIPQYKILRHFFIDTFPLLVVAVAAAVLLYPAGKF